jgi:hypothetical protein
MQTPEKAQRVSFPVTINGKFWNRSAGPGAFAQSFRLTAKKGQTLVLDVMARRLGSPLDSQIEVLDAQGRPIERAVLRAVGQTELTLSDRDSSSGGFRLTSWNDFHVGDYLLAGREVVRIRALPNGPDDDVAFRSFRGQRQGFFGTTPEFHSVGAPVYKVEVHPPGSRFSSNGMPLTPLYYQNDDGGPLYGKDSYLEFTAPADGDYLVRLTDARGQQGEDYAYRLMIHAPRPDFRIRLNPSNFNIPKGGGLAADVECERYEGFQDAVEVSMEGLPAGFTATSAVIEPGETDAVLLLSAAPDAVTPKQPVPIRVIARAVIAAKPSRAPSKRITTDGCLPCCPRRTSWSPPMCARSRCVRAGRRSWRRGSRGRTASAGACRLMCRTCRSACACWTSV